jgi:hypothetical protein
VTILINTTTTQTGNRIGIWNAFFLLIDFTSVTTIYKNPQIENTGRRIIDTILSTPKMFIDVWSSHKKTCANEVRGMAKKRMMEVVFWKSQYTKN